MPRTTLFTRVSMATAALALTASTAVAQPTGRLNITGSLRLTTAGGLFIDILDNSVTAEDGNTGSFASIADGTTGTMIDFSPTVGANNVPGLLTIGGFTFDLNQIFAGVFPSGGCTATPAAAGQVCTPTGTAFNLANLSSSSSTAAFRGAGTVTGAGGTSNFTGTFTTQFDNQSFQQAIAGALTPGGIQASFSAQLTATSVIPEPSTYALMATGLIALGGVAVRRRNMA